MSTSPDIPIASETITSRGNVWEWQILGLQGTMLAYGITRSERSAQIHMLLAARRKQWNRSDQILRFLNNETTAALEAQLQEQGYSVKKNFNTGAMQIPLVAEKGPQRFCLGVDLDSEHALHFGRIAGAGSWRRQLHLETGEDYQPVIIAVGANENKRDLIDNLDVILVQVDPDPVSAADTTLAALEKQAPVAMMSRPN